MIKNVLLLLVMLNVGPSGCRCNREPAPTYECTSDITVLLPEKAVSMFYFKEGSYWIYQREDSLYTDSVWVSGTQQGVYPVDRSVYKSFKGQKCYESWNTYLASLNGHFFHMSQYSIHNRFPKTDTSYSEELFVLYDGWQETSQIRLNFVGNEIEIINAYGDSVYHINSIEVQGTTYYDITAYKKKVQQPDYLGEAFYAPGWGMIKFKDKYDATWNLIRCRIIQ